MEYDPDMRLWAFYTAIVGDADITDVEISNSLEVREVQWVSLSVLFEGSGPGTVLQLHGLGNLCSASEGRAKVQVPQSDTVDCRIKGACQRECRDVLESRGPDV